jgi:hypothetical protein
VLPATVPLNRRFLGYVACARGNFHNRYRQELDSELIKFVGEMEHKFPVFAGALAALQLVPPA